MDNVPDIKLDDRLSKRGCIGCLVVLQIVIGGIATYTYFVFHPRDRTQVSVKNLPVGTRWFCLVVAENRGEFELMNWSPHYIFPGEMSPLGCVMSYPDGEQAAVNRPVMWKFGSHYGVVTRGTDKVWRITWFKAVDIPIQGRGSLLGEGEVEIDLGKGQTAQMNADDMRRFGFQDFHWADEK